VHSALLSALLVCLAVAPSADAAGRAQDVTWHGTQIKMYDAQSAGRSGSGIVVAVLDGWVDRAHPDFEGRVLAGADCTSGTCVANQTRDGCTHGTHVAGTVASSSFGVAPKATVLPVRVLTDDGQGGCTGRPADVAAGIRWALAHGARVMNLSLGPDVPGLGSSSEIPTAVSEAAAQGVVVVFSAGNADLPVAQAYGQNALVVAATGPSGRLADYSQHGTGVSVAAPGGQPSSPGTCSQRTCVTSLYPDGKYAVAAGTSMAAPHVSGIAALLLGQRPGRSRQDVLNRITGTAHALSGAGAGLVDARAALGVVASRPRPTATSKPAPVPVVKPSTPTRTVTPPRPATPAPTPTPAPVATTAAPTAGPSPSPTSTAVAEAPLTLGTATPIDEVPVPLAVVALALVALGVTSVLTVSMRRG
jgi:subtilisin family serine protease